MIVRTCEGCGAEFTVRFPSVRTRRCSRSCGSRAARQTNRVDGSANPNWATYSQQARNRRTSGWENRQRNGAGQFI